MHVRALGNNDIQQRIRKLCTVAAPINPTESPNSKPETPGNVPGHPAPFSPGQNVLPYTLAQQCICKLSQAGRATLRIKKVMLVAAACKRQALALLTAQTINCSGCFVNTAAASIGLHGYTV